MTGNILSGLSIGISEIITKMLLYYFHERLWFKSRFKNHKLRHFVKTFTWRFVGTVDTVIIASLITRQLEIGLKIGLIEILTKMILYYFHEKIWYRFNFGLSETRHK